jgi:hypothetical protein
MISIGFQKRILEDYGQSYEVQDAEDYEFGPDEYPGGQGNHQPQRKYPKPSFQIFEEEISFTGIDTQ